LDLNVDSCSFRGGKKANLHALTGGQVGFGQVKDTFDIARIHRLSAFFTEPAVTKNITKPA
jgi:hypothetical protein